MALKHDKMSASLGTEADTYNNYVQDDSNVVLYVFTNSICLSPNTLQ